MITPQPVTQIDRHVAARLKYRRLMLGLRQKQLGQQLGVSQNMIRKYESGECRLASARLYAIAQALGVSPSWFFEGLADREPVPSFYGAWFKLVQNFLAASPHHQAALLNMARALAGDDE